MAPFASSRHDAITARSCQLSGITTTRASNEGGETALVGALSVIVKS